MIVFLFSDFSPARPLLLTLIASYLFKFLRSSNQPPNARLFLRDASLGELYDRSASSLEPSGSSGSAKGIIDGTADAANELDPTQVLRRRRQGRHSRRRRRPRRQERRKRRPLRPGRRALLRRLRVRRRRHRRGLCGRVRRRFSSFGIAGEARYRQHAQLHPCEVRGGKRKRLFFSFRVLSKEKKGKKGKKRGREKFPRGLGPLGAPLFRFVHALCLPTSLSCTVTRF